MSTTTEPLVTVDGTPLKTSLARAQRRSKIRALMLVVPLFLFIMVTFFIPIANMLFRSVENNVVTEIMPKTTKAIVAWDEQGSEIPGDDVFNALADDFKIAAANKTIGKVGLRLNYEKSGFLEFIPKICT